MLPDRVSNPGPLTYESGALPIALRGPAKRSIISIESSSTVYDSRTSQLFVMFCILTLFLRTCKG